MVLRLHVAAQFIKAFVVIFFFKVGGLAEIPVFNERMARVRERVTLPQVGPNFGSVGYFKNLEVLVRVRASGEVLVHLVVKKAAPEIGQGVRVTEIHINPNVG